MYNLAILEDMAIVTHHRIIAKTVVPHENLKQGIVLFKVWLTQRTMRYGPDAFDGHMATLLLAYLVQTRRISTSSNSLAVFQTMLTFLCEVDFLQSVLDFTSADIVNMSRSEDFSGAKGRAGVLSHPIVSATADSSDSTNYNALWRVSRSSLIQLKSEARKSLTDLQTSQDSCFENLFMLSRGFYASHDVYFHVPMNCNQVESAVLANKSSQLAARVESAEDGVQADDEIRFSVDTERDLHNAILDHNSHVVLSAKIRDVIAEALGDRAEVVHTFVHNVRDGEQAVTTNRGPKYAHAHLPVMPLDTEAGDDSSSEWVISVGVVLNREKVHRRVDRGPSPDDTAALVQFRRFWGDRCQLRRFQDGAIIEAVVWEPPASHSSSIVDVVIRYSLGRHVYCVCGETSENVLSVSSQLESQYFRTSIPCGSQVGQAALSPYEDGNKLTRTAVEALDQLRGILTSQIKNIPLSFESLMAVSPELRYTAVHGPRPHPMVSSDKEWMKTLSGSTISLIAPPLTVIAKLESSGKWPVDPAAIKKSKTALLLRARSELMKQFEVSY